MLLEKHSNGWKPEKHRKDSIEKIHVHLYNGKRYNASKKGEKNTHDLRENIEENILYPREEDGNEYFCESDAKIALQSYSSIFPALANSDFECPETDQYKEMKKNPKKYKPQIKKVEKDKEEQGPGEFGAYNIDSIVLDQKKKKEIYWVGRNIDPHDNIPDDMITLEPRQYPELRSDAKQYLGLLRQYMTALCEELDFKHQAIDIVPYSQNSLMIFIAAPAIYIKKVIATIMNKPAINKCYQTLNKILNLLKTDKVRPSSANDKLILYRRDKGSRFQYVFENRLARIEKEIASLNNLHSKANYRYSQEDFIEGEERLRKAISKFNRGYNQHFFLVNLGFKIELESGSLKPASSLAISVIKKAAEGKQ